MHHGFLSSGCFPRVLPGHYPCWFCQLHVFQSILNLYSRLPMRVRSVAVRECPNWQERTTTFRFKPQIPRQAHQHTIPPQEEHFADHDLSCHPCSRPSATSTGVQPLIPFSPVAQTGRGWRCTPCPFSQNTLHRTRRWLRNSLGSLLGTSPLVHNATIH